MSKKKKQKTHEEEINQDVQETIDDVEDTESAEGDEDAKTQEKPAEEKLEDKLQKELDDEKDKFLRLAAEYDNYRKRTLKEREGIYSDVKSETVAKFLPVYDNIERALAHETTDEAFYKGVEMIMAGFKEIFSKLGVEEIPAMGEAFDPELHNAVMHVEDETKGNNEIVEELQKGFKLGDKVIRFSLVKVAN